MSRRVPGASLGRAGGSLTNATWAANGTVARIGQTGEVRTGALLDALAAKDGGPSVLHDLRIPIPGFSANIDHALVVGRDIYLIDAKVWRPGFYWTLGGITRRGLERFAPAEKKTMAMAHDRVATWCPRGRVLTPLLVVWPSSKRARLSMWAMTAPGARVVTGEKFTRMLASRSLVRPADAAVVQSLSQLLIAPGRPYRHAA